MPIQKNQSDQQTGADIVVKTLEQHEVSGYSEFQARRSTRSSTLWSIHQFRPLSAGMSRTQLLLPEVLVA